jgi:hypothetical protein
MDSQAVTAERGQPLPNLRLYFALRAPSGTMIRFLSGQIPPPQQNESIRNESRRGNPPPAEQCPSRRT